MPDFQIKKENTCGDGISTSTSSLTSFTLEFVMGCKTAARRPSTPHRVATKEVSATQGECDPEGDLRWRRQRQCHRPTVLGPWLAGKPGIPWEGDRPYIVFECHLRT